MQKLKSLEIIFNIWYLMRNGPRRARHSVRFLTVFLQSCFNAQERRRLASNVLADQAIQMKLPLALASQEPDRTLRQQLLDHAQYCADQSGRLEDFQDIALNLPAIVPAKGFADSRRVKAAADLFSKAQESSESGDLKQAVDIYDSLVAHFGAAEEPALRQAVARALVNKGIALDRLGRPEPAIEAYDNVVARFGEAEEPALRDQVARALVNKGVALAKLGRPELAIEACDTIVARFGEAEEPALRKTVARALIYKGITLAELGCPEPAIEAYDSVVAHFRDTEDPALREQVARALVNKGVALARLDQIEAARDVYQAALALNPESPSILNGLGNLYLDALGNPHSALSTFKTGLIKTPDNSSQVILNANCAYAIALHGGDLTDARRHAEKALQDGETLSAAGRHLLEALPIWHDSPKPNWQHLFECIGNAVESGDGALWNNFFDDLQRVIEFVIRQGEGTTLKHWMEDQQYPLRQAPLYHALVAALDGEDHLLKINPETREPSQRIYDGIARLMRLYAPTPASKKPRAGKKGR